jgi:hypothetical protein
LNKNFSSILDSVINFLIMVSELIEEVESINAIYENSTINVGPNIYEITIPDTSYKVRLSFPSKYPQVPPQLLSIKGPRTNRDDSETLQILKEVIDEVFSAGMVCIFDFMESAKELLNADEELVLEDNIETKDIDPFTGWHSTEQTVDRKSVFIGYSAPATSKEEAIRMIDQLKQDKRIARASHNITAWRIVRPDGVLLQDCDDDGESAAGSRLLHLLNLTDSKNVVVVVSRWYGGIHLGSDR